VPAACGKQNPQTCCSPTKRCTGSSLAVRVVPGVQFMPGIIRGIEQLLPQVWV
jgi:hypothetical protein